MSKKESVKGWCLAIAVLLVAVVSVKRGSVPTRCERILKEALCAVMRPPCVAGSYSSWNSDSVYGRLDSRATDSPNWIHLIQGTVFLNEVANLRVWYAVEKLSIEPDHTNKVQQTGQPRDDGGWEQVLFLVDICLLGAFYILPTAQPPPNHYLTILS